MNDFLNEGGSENLRGGLGKEIASMSGSCCGFECCRSNGDVFEDFHFRLCCYCGNVGFHLSSCVSCSRRILLTSRSSFRHR